MLGQRVLAAARRQGTSQLPGRAATVGTCLPVAHAPEAGRPPAGPGRGRPDLRAPGVPPRSLLGTAGVRKQRFPGDDGDSSHSPLASTPPLPLCLPGAGPPVPTEGHRLPAVTPSSPCAPVSAPPCDTPSHTQASVLWPQQPPAAGGSSAPLAQTGRSVGGTAGARGLAAPATPASGAPSESPHAPVWSCVCGPVTVLSPLHTWAPFSQGGRSRLQSGGRRGPRGSGS